jgi:methionine S-methyltransferase
MEKDIATAGKESAFLKNCETSSSAAFENLSALLELLENKETVNSAGKLLFNLVEDFSNTTDKEAFQNRYHFSFHKISLSSDTSKKEELILLQLPSIFSPEEWSFTFYEGLARYPISEFYDKTLVELGTGNGWISIALAKRCMPKKVVGLDINPKAIVCAKLNIYLNSMAENGEFILDEEGKTIADRVEFHTSDLLEHCIENRIRPDHIIGCIPQVLNPDPEMALNISLDNASDEFLYSLSNYCAQQGYVEDQFGLGLIAKALEQAVETITPAAKVIMNMGGRPGTAVLDRLFTRRGFEIKKVWHRKIVQAADTEIKPLVEIENLTKHRFEFFMGISASEPISAKTALAYAAKGGEIAHSLTVYEAKLRNHTAIKPIFSLLKRSEYGPAKSALDLAFENKSIADEKTAFLSRMSQKAEETKYYPYGHTVGDEQLKEHLSNFIKSYFQVPISQENFLIAPNINALIKNILDLYRPKTALVDKDFSRFLPQEWLSAMPGESNNTAIIETPGRVNLTINLMQTLKPEIVITRLADFEHKSPDSLIRLMDAAASLNTRIFIDISNSVDLSSTPENNAVFQYMRENPLPPHCSVLAGLVKNLVYEDLQISFLLSENKNLIEDLTNVAEFNYSRTPLLNQEYYSQILFDLLKFHLPASGAFAEKDLRNPINEAESFKRNFISPCAASIESFTHPAITGNQFTITKETVRLDYGENCLPAPETFKVAVFESFARQNFSHEEVDPTPEIKQLLHQKFSINQKINAEMIFASGVAPIFAALAEICKEEGGTMIFPSAAYGYFIACCKFYSVPYKIINTSEENAFKINSELLKNSLKEIKNPWLFFNFPVINPTGAKYLSGETKDILSFCSENNFKVIFDTIFSGLEFDRNQVYPELESFFGKSETGENAVLLGGISKEFAAGGIRFGYAYTRSSSLKQKIESKLLSEPHDTVKYACKKLFEKQTQQDSALISELETQRKTLKERAKNLNLTLEQTGWKPLASEGGLFMVAKPEFYFGRKIKYKVGANEKEITLDSENISEALYYATSLLINNSSWTEIPGYCRFVLSVEDNDFEKGIKRLKDFYELVSGS